MIGILPRRNLPMVFQSETSECGLACLAMIRGYFGGNSDIQNLRTQGRLGGNGITVKTLLDVSDQIALNGRAVKFNLGELQDLRLPAILHWDMDHFVVLQRVARRKVTIFDPAVGVRDYEITELSQHLSGVAVELCPKPDFQPQRSGPILRLRDLFAGSALDSSEFVKLLLMSVLLQVFALLSPLYLQLVIDQTILRGDFDLLLVLASCFFILLGLKTLLAHLRSMRLLGFGNRVGFDLISGLARHLFSLPLKFFERRETGDILSRLDSAEKIKLTVTQDLLTVLVDGLFSLLALALLYWYSTTIANLVLIAVMLVCLVNLMAVLREKVLREEVLIHGAKQQTRFLEGIRHIATAKVYGIEQTSLNAWEECFTDQLNASYKLSEHQLFFGSIKAFILGIENLLVIYVGAQAVMNNSITIGQLMGVVFLKQHFIASVSAMIPKLAELKLLRLELDRVAEIALTKPEANERRVELLPTQLARDISIVNLRYRYDAAQHDLLKGFSFTIKQGTLTALTGTSGSGKSTFIKLLLGLIPLQEGAIYIGEKPLAQVSRADLRNNVSAVLHEDGLIAGDLAYNIALCHEDFNLNKLKRVAGDVGLLETIESLPMGFSTTISEMGSCFSAGQVQRILIARALYRDPKILILDETLANLNLKAARKLLDHIRSQAITTLFVSHNRSLVEYADAELRLD